MKISPKDSRSLDALKGILLTLVIFGHLFSNRVTEDPIKYWLYGFHMPVFLFVSGYLISRSSLKNQNLGQVIKSRFLRLIVPWIIASLLFLGIYNPDVFTSGVKHFIKELFLSPYFHLWYIPAVLAQLCLMWFVERLGRFKWMLALIIAIAAFSAFEFPGSPIPNTVIDHRYLGYFIYFMIGYLHRNFEFIKLNSRVFLGVTTGSAILYAVSFYLDDHIQFLCFVFFSICCCQAVPLVIKTLSRHENGLTRIFSNVGKGSLWLYLAHPLITNNLKMREEAGPIDLLMGVSMAIGLSLIFGYIYGWFRCRNRDSKSSSPSP